MYDMVGGLTSEDAFIQHQEEAPGVPINVISCIVALFLCCMVDPPV